MKHNKNTYSFQTLSFIFDDDIEKVYKSFFTPKILYKAGIIGTILEVNHYEITTNTADNAKVKGINYKFCKPLSCNLDAIYSSKVINESHFKSLSQKITAINGQKINSNFYICYNYYVNTANNSTIVTFEIESDKKNNPFMKLYYDLIPKEAKLEYCSKIKAYLNHWNQRVLTMESIVIERPFKQILEYIRDLQNILPKLHDGNQLQLNDICTSDLKEKVYNVYHQTKKKIIKYTISNVFEERDKAIVKCEKEINAKKGIKKTSNMTVVKLSPVSSFVTIESEIPGCIKGEYYNFVSQYLQTFLQKVKTALEKKVCYDESISNLDTL